jgi:prepilin-type N-terminal cleavage/methylation domain-containing protein
MILDQNRGSRQRGFTLIEMSIVLVIIGLIIGGILKGQEIVANARNKSTWNFAQAARAAANTYFDRYRAIPGDDPNAAARLDARVAAGNGNSIVGAQNADSATFIAVNAGAGEMLQYFNGLMAANLINGGSVNSATTATTFGPGSPLPSAPISGAGMLVGYSIHAGTTGAAGTARSAHWYLIAKTPAAPIAAMSPREVANLDTQFDDGLGTAGAVRADEANTNCVASASTGLYVIGDSAQCIPMIEAHP